MPDSAIYRAGLDRGEIEMGFKVSDIILKMLNDLFKVIS